MLEKKQASKNKPVLKTSTPALRHRNLVLLSLQKQASLGNVPQWTNFIWIWVGANIPLTTLARNSFNTDLKQSFGKDTVPQELLDEIQAYFMQTNSNGIIQFQGLDFDTTDLGDLAKTNGPLWMVVMGQSTNSSKDSDPNLALKVNAIMELLLNAGKFVMTREFYETAQIIESERILYLNNMQKGLLGAVAGVYLPNASTFGLYAPLYGLQIQGVDSEFNEVYKNGCADKNINFYTEANEDNPTGQFMLKEGVGATGEDMDKTLSLFYIKLIATQKFVQYLLSNGGINLKLSSSTLYKNKLNTIFTGFQSSNLILSFKFIGEPIVNIEGTYHVEIEIVYNGTIKKTELIVLDGSL